VCLLLSALYARRRLHIQHVVPVALRTNALQHRINQWSEERRYNTAHVHKGSLTSSKLFQLPCI
jgi:hypothetical protein